MSTQIFHFSSLFILPVLELKLKISCIVEQVKGRCMAELSAGSFDQKRPCGVGTTLDQLFKAKCSSTGVQSGPALRVCDLTKFFLYVHKNIDEQKL